MVKVEGKNKKHVVQVYALSTCPHCMATKQFLREEDIEFEYIDVDLCDKKELAQIMNDIKRRGSSLSFPKIIIDGKLVITGLDREKIKEALKSNS